MTVTTWQPIDTAPKDGNFVLISGLNYGNGPERHYQVAHYGRFNDGRLGFLNEWKTELLEYADHWRPIERIENATR